VPDLTSAQRTILRFLDGNPASMPMAVMRSSGLQPTACRAALGSLMSLGLVVERSGGSVEITTEGRGEVQS